MVRITRPLFGDSARGRVGDVGYFRTRNGQAVLSRMPRQAKRDSPELEAWREEFRAAHAAWMQIEPTAVRRTVGGKARTFWIRLPAWPEFWRGWLAGGGQPPEGPPSGYQWLRPDRDLTVGAWADVPLWEKLHTYTPDDQAWIHSPPGVEAWGMVGLEPGEGWASQYGCTVVVRARKSQPGGQSVSLDVKARGAWGYGGGPYFSLTDEWQTVQYVLDSQWEAPDLGHLGDVRMSFWALPWGGGGARGAEISWAQLRVGGSPPPPQDPDW